jgi:hypothetical protein
MNRWGLTPSEVAFLKVLIGIILGTLLILAVLPFWLDIIQPGWR